MYSLAAMLGRAGRVGPTTILIQAASVIAVMPFGAGRLAGQRPAVPSTPIQDSVTVVPGPGYGATAIYRALVGTGYRDLWTTAIRVPIANVATLVPGGLTPVEMGTGAATQSLYLESREGLRYVFRPVNKTSTALLAELEGTIAADILQDEMSSFHPSGAVIVAGLLDALGVLHPNPRLLVVPDDPRLGPFRDEFAGKLVLFEERPADPPDGATGFAGSREILQTGELFERLAEGPENRIQVQELLRSRLVDLLVGDRDRSPNNHFWARFPDEDIGGPPTNQERYLWRPIPRDRDQAFVTFDGALDMLDRRYDDRLVRFRAEYDDTRAVSRNAWDIDRNFLVGMDRTSWDATVQDVRSALTDDVIRDAVSRMPREHYAIRGAEIEASLRGRRDRLQEAAEGLYRIVFQFADIHATDADEVAEIQSREDGSVRVVLSRRGDGGRALGDPFYDRVFDPSETVEIRLYLHGGNDLTLLTGPATPILLRVIGEGGSDEIRSEGGAFAIFYDTGDDILVEGPRIVRVSRSPARPFSWFGESYDIDWGRRTIPTSALGYDGDRGFVPTVGVIHTEYGFGRAPFAYRFTLSAGWAFTPGQPIVESSLHIRQATEHTDLELDARYSGIDVVTFFGLGNETSTDEPASYYQADQRQLEFSARLSFGDVSTWRVTAGPVYTRVVSDTVGAANYLTEAAPPGTGTVSQLGVRFSGHLDGRDETVAPTSGFLIETGVDYYPGVLDDEDSFGTVTAMASTYLSPAGKNPTLALRIGGTAVWGDYPYYEAAFLGGRTTLRGLREGRYAGDSMIHASVEVRASLARLGFRLPIDVGALGFVDVGRVFLKGESSSRWHVGSAGGLWFAPITRWMTLRLTVARSEGSTAFYAGMGFAF